jgi:DNA-directed RNA polymerase subunit M/transcription elongation factor TFIIS
MSSSLMDNFCPVCDMYLYLKSSEASTTEADKKIDVCRRVCMNCSYKRDNTKGGLISEMAVGQKMSEAFKIMVNEFTIEDPTLPHIKSLPCPNERCPSNNGEERDIIYMTYDIPGKKNLYVCVKCNEKWKSR